MATDATGLTVFLIKEDQVSAVEKAFPQAQALALPDGLDGWFRPMQSKGAIPPWVKAMETYLTQPLSLTSVSPAGVMVLRRAGRTYAVTFGYAWQLLEDEWLERDFGRRVALNLIRRDGLIELRTEQVFASWHLASDRAPRASLLDEFGVEFDRDLVATVEGAPLDEALGKTVRGGTSLRVILPLPKLPAFLDKGEKLFKSDKYKDKFPDIDNLSPVKDSSLIVQLEAALDADFLSGVALKRLVLFTPTFRRDEPLEAESYVFGRMSTSPVSRPYLTADMWTTYLEEDEELPSVAVAKKTKVHLLDKDGEEAKSCSVFECLGYEVSLAGRPHVLSSGIWYEVAPDFVGRVNKVIASLSSPKVGLPAWTPTESESEYNQRCCKTSGFRFFDEKLVSYGGNQSKFEFCDVMHLSSNTLYFAKIVSRSSGMSHLLEQVRRTAELFFSPDVEYRRKLTSVAKKTHPDLDLKWLENHPRPGDWNLCLVSLGRSAKTLPFFAKCGLMKLVKELRRAGHRVSFTDV